MRSRKNTFGWVRAEILGALVNAVFLLALCFSIFVEAIKRLVEARVLYLTLNYFIRCLQPEEINNPKLILIVGVLGLAVNIIGIFLFHSTFYVFCSTFTSFRSCITWWSRPLARWNKRGRTIT
jgi:zinc transporter 1